MREEQEGEYRNLKKAFCDWSESNGLLLNTSKTKELVIDYSRTKPHLQPINIQGNDIVVVQTYKFLGVHLDDKLNRSANAGPPHPLSYL